MQAHTEVLLEAAVWTRRSGPVTESPGGGGRAAFAVRHAGGRPGGRAEPDRRAVGGGEMFSGRLSLDPSPQPDRHFSSQEANTGRRGEKKMVREQWKTSSRRTPAKWATMAPDNKDAVTSHGMTRLAYYQKHGKG